MKQHLIFASSLTIFASLLSGARAAQTHHYANAITANNIAVMQHSIINTAMGAGDRLSSATLNTEEIFAHTAKPQNEKNPTDLYGHAPMYGTMPMYGEYNDDGSIGRSGGDVIAPALGHMWFAWQHFGNDTKFQDIPVLESDIELAMVGLAGDKSRTDYGMTEWGIFTGYIGGAQEQSDMTINEDGGYFGVYKKFTFGHANILTALNAGVLSNSVDTITMAKTATTDDFTNIWAGGAINAAYNIEMDDTFTFQPSLYAGYTWIKSDNYTTALGEQLNNQDFHMFEVAPTIRFIKHIGNGWFGAAHAKYVMLFDNGGETELNGTEISALESDNFTEYGITLEKTIERFNITANIGRRDGGHTGWMGGFNLKYIF